MMSRGVKVAEGGLALDLQIGVLFDEKQRFFDSKSHIQGPSDDIAVLAACGEEVADFEELVDICL